MVFLRGWDHFLWEKYGAEIRFFLGRATGKKVVVGNGSIALDTFQALPPVSVWYKPLLLIMKIRNNLWLPFYENVLKNFHSCFSYRWILFWKVFHPLPHLFSDNRSLKCSPKIIPPKFFPAEIFSAEIFSAEIGNSCPNFFALKFFRQIFFPGKF